MFRKLSCSGLGHVGWFFTDEEHGWPVMYFFLWPHIAALSVTSHLLTPGHKMATYTVMFSRLSKVNVQGK